MCEAMCTNVFLICDPMEGGHSRFEEWIFIDICSPLWPYPDGCDFVWIIDAMKAKTRSRSRTAVTDTQSRSLITFTSSSAKSNKVEMTKNHVKPKMVS